MRILVDYRPAIRARTGVGEYVHEVVRALLSPPRPAGESLTLFSSSWKDRIDGRHLAAARLVDRRLPVRVLNLLWHRAGWPPVETLAGESPDVVHSPHPLLLPSRRAAQVITIHDLDFLDHPERARAEIRRDYPPLAAAHAARADHIVVNSAHTGAEVTRRFGIAPDRLTVALPGAPDWPRRRAEPEGGCLLFLGTLDARKNIPALVDAYERLLAHRPDAPPLVIAGRRTPAIDALVARTGRAPLAGRVEWPDYVDDAGRLELFRRAILLIIPSHMEGFGMTALEAMATGVPVVATRGGALPETIGDAGHLVETDDAAALASGIELLLADRASRDRLREAGWRRATEFSWRRTADGWREAWARAVDARARRRA